MFKQYNAYDACVGFDSWNEWAMVTGWRIALAMYLTSP